MKSYCLLADDSIEFLKLSKETYYLSLGRSKLKAAHPVIIFLDFGAKILKLAHPVNYSYLPPWHETLLLLSTQHGFLNCKIVALGWSKK